MKVKKFESMEQYEAWADSFENDCDRERFPVLIDDGRHFRVDLETECKTWKTALNRFRKTFEPAGLSDWLGDEMQEACENGVFSFRWLTPEEVKESEDGISQYFWGVEEVAPGTWYVYATLSGCQHP